MAVTDPWEDTAVAEIVLFHSALGLRPGINVAADILRAGGHTVHTPDLFRGRALFDEPEPAVEYCRRDLGLTELLARARADVEPLPAGLVYAGFSLGATFAAVLAATRPGARAAILLSGTPVPEAVRAASWPPSVPVEAYHMTADSWINPASLARLDSFIRAAGGTCTIHEYPGAGHLFADPDLPDYDAATAELMWQSVLAFLDRVDGRTTG